VQVSLPNGLDGMGDNVGTYSRGWELDDWPRKGRMHQKDTMSGRSMDSDHRLDTDDWTLDTTSENDKSMRDH